MAKFYVYARKSTSDQTSIDAQIDYGKKLWPQFPGLELEVVDDGKSGRDVAGRPKFMAILNALQEGDGLCVWDSSRLGRNAPEIGSVRNLFKERKAFLVEAGRVYEDTASDTLFSQIIDSVSQFQRSLQREKSLLGIAFRRKKGDWRFRDVFGYDHDAKRKSVTINKEQATIVKWMFDEHSSGKSLNQICKELNYDLVRTLRGGKWTPTTVRRILLRPLYSGHYLKVGAGARKGSYTQAQDYRREDLVASNFYQPPIIELATFELSLLTFLRAERPHLKKADQRGSKYLFSGFIFCGLCVDNGQRDAYSTFVHKLHKIRNSQTENEDWKLTSLHSTRKHKDTEIVWTVREIVLRQLLVTALGNMLHEKTDEIDHFLLFDRKTTELKTAEKELVILQLRSKITDTERTIRTNMSEISKTTDDFIQNEYRKANEALATKRKEAKEHLTQIEEDLKFESSRLRGLSSIKKSIEDAFFPRFAGGELPEDDWIFEDPKSATLRERKVLKEFLNGIFVYPGEILISFKPKFEYKFIFTRRYGRGFQKEYPAYSRTPLSPEWKPEGTWLVVEP